jgi:hypothetical protein
LSYLWEEMEIILQGRVTFFNDSRLPILKMLRRRSFSI